jgi:hypothetical protein
MNRLAALSLILVALSASVAGSAFPADAAGCKHKTKISKRPDVKPKMDLQKISYRKTGGFAGISKGVDITVSSLSADEQKQLQTLFEEAKLPKHEEKRTPGAADVFYYSIEATTAKGTYEVLYDDVSLPGSVRPLVQFLDGKSETLPRN